MACRHQFRRYNCVKIATAEAGTHGLNYSITARTVGHRQNTGSCVLEGEVFVGELGPVNGFPARSVVVGEVTALAHESGNDAVKGRAFEAKARFAGAQLTKVLGRLGDDIGTELHDDTTGGLATNGNIKVHLRFGPGKI